MKKKDDMFYWIRRAIFPTRWEWLVDRLAMIMKTLLTAIFVLLLAGFAQAATISWSDNSNNEDSFKIYRATNALAPFVLVGTVAANTTTFLDSAGIAGNCWRVTAVNAAGESQPSNVACLPTPVLVIPLSPSGTSVVP